VAKLILYTLFTWRHCNTLLCTQTAPSVAGHDSDESSDDDNGQAEDADSDTTAPTTTTTTAATIGATGASATGTADADDDANAELDEGGDDVVSDVAPPHVQVSAIPAWTILL
jgi:hypothetical protein